VSRYHNYDVLSKTYYFSKPRSGPGFSSIKLVCTTKSKDFAAKVYETATASTVSDIFEGFNKANYFTFKETLDSGSMSILLGSILNSRGHCGSSGLGFSVTA
jgi:hypothetical protein